MLLAGGAGSGSIVMIVAYLVVIIAIFYFMMVRPQKKEQKRKDEMFACMEPGDPVMTTSGFYGVIIDITDEDVIVEFGNNKNCRIVMTKEAIAKVEKAE